MKSTPLPAMVCVFRGKLCLGFLLTRGADGYEAFDADGASLGLFSTRRAAAGSLMMRGPP